MENLSGPRSLRRYAIKRGSCLVSLGATEWVYIDYKTGRVKDVPDDIAVRFAIIDNDDARLVDLGFARGVRFEPHYYSSCNDKYLFKYLSRSSNKLS